MGARGRDRARGRALPLGWDEETAPTGASAPTGPDAPPARSGSDPGPAEDDESQPTPDPHRRSRRSRRLIAAGAVLVLVGALLIALPRLIGVATGPEQVTREFLQAVVDGDLETVRDHVQGAPDASTAALTAEVLAGAEDRLDSFEIQHVAVEAGTATVTAELRNGTGSSEGVFTLTSSSAGAFSPTVWELAPVVLPELEIDLTFGVQEIEIEGVTFPVEDLRVERETYESRIALQLLPGTYEVTLPEVPPWLEAPQAALEVLPAFGATAAPLHSLSPTFDETSQAEVQHQIDAALEGCAARTSSIPEGCPFAVPGHAGQGAWRITHPPRVDATPVGLFLWMVHGEGTAQFTPSGRAADEAAPLEVPFTVTGAAAFDSQGTPEVGLDSAGELSFGFCTDAEGGGITGAVLLEESEQDVASECG
ncbi:MAG: hypothetical protein L0J84_07875 [Brachybacterium sp.]|nr:hypothetical protein [Brachybacterium sp.]